MKLCRSLAFALVLILGAPASLAGWAQTADRTELRAWQGRYPHHEVAGRQGRMKKESFFMLPSVREPLASLLGPDFLAGVEEGDYLEKRIELIGDFLVIQLFPNPRRIDDERRLIIIVPLASADLHAVYYQEDFGDDARRQVMLDWKHSPGKSLDDLPKSLKASLATIMGLP